MKNMRQAGLLAVVLIALVSLATWDEWQTEKDEALEKQKKQLLDVETADITGLKYFDKSSEDDKNSTAVEFQLSKKAGEWRLTEPVEAKADQAAVDNLLKSLVDYQFESEVASESSEWSKFGVGEDASRKLTITHGSDQSDLDLFVGTDAAVGFSVFSRTSNSSQVFVGSQHLRTSTKKTLDDFRYKAVTEFTDAEVNSITYQLKGQESILILKRDGKMVMTQPGNYEIDASEVKSWVSQLGSLKATGFIDETKDSELLDLFSDEQAFMVFTWEKTQKKAVGSSEESDNTKTERLIVVQQGSELFAATHPEKVIYKLAPEVEKQLKKSVLDLRDRRVVEFNVGDVEKLEIDGKSFESIGGVWYPATNLTAAKEIQGKIDALASKTDSDMNSSKDLKAEESSSSGSELESLEDALEELGDGRPRSLLVDLEFAKTNKFILPNDTVIGEDLREAPYHTVTLVLNSEGKESSTLQLKAFKVSGDEDNFYLQNSAKLENLFLVPKTVFETFAPKSTDKAGLSLPEFGGSEDQSG